MSQIQSYMFYKPDWSKQQIKQFLNKNKIVGMGYLDTTANFYRYRIFNPPKNKQYRITTISQYPLLKAVIMF